MCEHHKKDSAAYNCAVRREVILTSRLARIINFSLTYRPVYKSRCTREAYLRNALFMSACKSVCNDKTAQAVQSVKVIVCVHALLPFHLLFLCVDH